MLPKNAQAVGHIANHSIEVDGASVMVFGIDEGHFAIVAKGDVEGINGVTQAIGFHNDINGCSPLFCHGAALPFMVVGFARQDLHVFGDENKVHPIGCGRRGLGRQGIDPLFRYFEQMLIAASLDGALDAARPFDAVDHMSVIHDSLLIVGEHLEPVSWNMFIGRYDHVALRAMLGGYKARPLEGALVDGDAGSEETVKFGPDRVIVREEIGFDCLPDAVRNMGVARIIGLFGFDLEKDQQSQDQEFAHQVTPLLFSLVSCR